MLLLVLPICNCARGLVAKWQGDDSAECSGRITLNPFVHLDPIGSLMILLVGLGWSKPMPINPTRMKNYRKGILLTSLAGPVANLISAIVCNLIRALLLCSQGVLNSLSSDEITPIYCLMTILSIISNINVCLAVIELLPIPPMDGFNILHYFAGNKFNRWYYMNQRTINIVSMVIVLLLFTLPSEINPLYYLISLVSNLIYHITSWIPVVRWS